MNDQDRSLQHQGNIKQTSDENKEKYQLGDYKLIQYQILQTNITRTVWQTVRRITNVILGVKGFRYYFLSLKIKPKVNMVGFGLNSQHQKTEIRQQIQPSWQTSWLNKRYNIKQKYNIKEPVSVSKKMDATQYIFSSFWFVSVHACGISLKHWSSKNQ